MKRLLLHRFNDEAIEALVKVDADTSGFERKLSTLQGSITKVQNKLDKMNDPTTLKKLADQMDTINEKLQMFGSMGINDAKFKEKLARVTSYFDQVNSKVKAKGLDFNISTSSINNSTKQLTNLYNILSKLQSSNGSFNIASSLENLKSSGVYDSLPSGLTKLYNNIAALENTSITDPKTFEIVKGSIKQSADALKQFNDALDDSTDKGKENVDVVEQINKSHVSLLKKVTISAKVLRMYAASLLKWATSAGDYIESLNLYDMAVGSKFADAGQAWADKISNALYLDKKDVLQYAGSFYSMAKGLGVTAEAADLMSRNLTQLSFDMTSYRNFASNDTSYNKLTSAMSGQTKAVTNVGIAVQQASLQQTLYDLGIKRNIATLTQADKTYLRYIQIMKSTTQMQGDLGRTIITPTNAMRLLKTQFVILGRAVGQIFIPIMMKAIPLMVALTEIAKHAADTISALFGFKISNYRADIKSVSSAFEDIADSSDDARASMNRTLAAFDDLNVVENESNGSGHGSGTTIDWTPYLTGYDMLKDYTKSVTEEIDKAKNKLKIMLPIIGSIVGVLTVSSILGKIKKVTTNLSYGKEIISKTSGILGKITKMTGLDKIGTAVSKITGVGKKADDIAETKKVLDNVNDVSKSTKSFTVPDSKTVLKALGDIGIIIGATTAVIAIFGALSTIPGYTEFMVSGAIELKSIFDTLAQISLPLLEFGAVAAGIGLAQGFILSGLTTIGAVIGGSELVVAAFGGLNKIPGFGDFQASGEATLISLATTLQKVSVPLLEFGAIASTLDLLAPVALPGLGVIAAFIAGSEAVVAAFAGLNKIPGFSDFIEGGKELLIKLADTIGSFVGTLASSAISKSLDFIPAFGTQLSEFMTNATPFLDGLSNVDPSIPESGKYLADMILELTKAGVIDGLFGWVKGKASLNDFGVQLKKFGPNIKSFASSVKGLDTDLVKNSADAAKAIIEICKEIPNQGGVTAWFTGDNTLDVFSSYLPTFGKNLKKYGANIKGLDTDLVKNSADAAKALVEVTKQIPNEGGVAAWFAGDNKLTKFSSYLPDFGKDLKAYGDNVKDLDASVVNNSAAAAKAIVEISKQVPNQGGVASWFSGDNNIGTFGAQLATFGKYFAKYNDSIANINTAKMDSVTNALKSIVSLAQSIKDGGISKIMSTFGSSLASSVGGVNAFFSKTQAYNIGTGFGGEMARGLANAIKGYQYPTIEISSGSGSSKRYRLNAYASGGFPDRGDYFFANENGRAEYVGSIGGKTAVANQDQLVQAIASAATAIAGNTNNNNKQHLTIQIGSKTLYDGQIEYQNNQISKYGTSKFLQI